MRDGARRIFALAGGTALIALAAFALHEVHDAWRSALSAVALVEAQGLDPCSYYVGDGTPLSRGELDRMAVGLTVVLGGGLCVTALYGVRSCLAAVPGLRRAALPRSR